MTGSGLLEDAWSFLLELDGASLVLFFWFTLLIELPRYMLGSVVVALASLFERSKRVSLLPAPRVSVVVAGHNEADVLERCVRGLHEQTLAKRAELFEIIVVSDGSVDRTGEVVRQLERSGLITTGLCTRLRGGKSAVVNLGLQYCRGDIVFIIDADTTFDRDAFARMVEPFADPGVGAVPGNLMVRNAGASVTARAQAIEYLIGISLGRRVSDMLGILPVVSGAFGAFRRKAVLAVGGQDAEVGEDADLSTKLRREGWHVRFQPMAVGMTDVPAHPVALVKQRLRWERSIITIWARKFRSSFNPLAREFRIADALMLADAVFLPSALAVAFIGYLGWLLYFVGDMAWVILAASFVAYAMLALLALVTAIIVEGRWADLRLALYVPYYCLLNAYVLRLVRLWAFFDELAFRSSYRDPYVPSRVMRQVEKF